MRLALLILSVLFCQAAFTQYIISGTVTDENAEAISGAIITIDGTYKYAISDALGNYKVEIDHSGEYVLEVSHLGFEISAERIYLGSDTAQQQLDFGLSPKVITAEEVIVRATRANERVPMAYSTIDKMDLTEINLGQDIPELLNATPSLFFTSDAGNGVGYSYLRLRGSDQTNINVMVNGIPLNDSESQGVFWVNMPDFASSTESIQIQRGVGTSTNGAGAFGGSINLLTEGIRTDAYGEISTGLGSFNTSKVNAKLGTGLINGHWTVDGRLSYIQSDGFIDRASARLNSYHLAAGYTDGKNSLRAITFGGSEVTQQAWWGVPEGRITGDEDLMLNFAYDNGYTPEDIDNLLESDRSFNYYRYDNEVDDYGQDHYQLHYNRQIGAQNLLHVAAHYTKGGGYFEQFQDDANWSHDNTFDYYQLDNPIIGGDTIRSADFIRRRWLDNDFYGVVASLNIKKDRFDTWLGAGWNTYEGAHFGEVIWAQYASDSNIRHRYYDNDASKQDMNVYAKTSYAINSELSLFADLQYRSIDYTFFGNLQDGRQTDQTVSYAFFNPKAGLSYLDSKGLTAFVSYAIGNKEPNRDDHTASTPASRPKHQTLYDLELGVGKRWAKAAIELVVYDMQYDNQLVQTGEINDVGEGIRTNVASSYRRGVELIARLRPVQRIDWSGSIGFSENKIIDYVDLAGLGERLGDTDIAYSPSVVAGSELAVHIIQADPEAENRRALKMVLFSKYVGEQFLDNTSDARKTIDAFFVNDLRFNLDLGLKGISGLEFTFMIRNILDEEYSSNGWTYKYFLGPEPSDEVTFNAYYPQAGRNFMTGLTLKF